MPCTMVITAMRNMTPMSTPSTVKKLLSFCTLIVCNARLTASQRDMSGVFGRASGAGGADVVDAAAGVDARGEVGALLVARHHAVAQHDDAAGVHRDVRLVRHH